MKEITGDLLKMFRNKEFNVIIHGANCRANFGAGIAKQIKDQFFDAYQVDCEDPREPKEKLGSFSCHIYFNQQMIINAYTQVNYGAGLQVNYLAMQKSFNTIAASLKIMQDNKLFKNEFKIGYPAIGSGYGGGSWKTIAPLLDSAFEGFDHTLVKYNKNT